MPHDARKLRRELAERLDLLFFVTISATVMLLAIVLTGALAWRPRALLVAPLLLAPLALWGLAARALFRTTRRDDRVLSLPPLHWSRPHVPENEKRAA